MEERYCQDCAALNKQSNMAGESPRPCFRCGGTKFSTSPPLHSGPRKWDLNQRDVEFLRTQGIDPQVQVEDD